MLMYRRRQARILLDLEQYIWAGQMNMGPTRIHCRRALTFPWGSSSSEPQMLPLHWSTPTHYPFVSLPVKSKSIDRCLFYLATTGSISSLHCTVVFRDLQHPLRIVQIFSKGALPQAQSQQPCTQHFDVSDVCVFFCHDKQTRLDW